MVTSYFVLILCIPFEDEVIPTFNEVGKFFIALIMKVFSFSHANELVIRSYYPIDAQLCGALISSP